MPTSNQAGSKFLMSENIRLGPLPDRLPPSLVISVLPRLPIERHFLRLDLVQASKVVLALFEAFGPQHAHCVLDAVNLTDRLKVKSHRFGVDDGQVESFDVVACHHVGLVDLFEELGEHFRSSLWLSEDSGWSADGGVCFVFSDP